MDEGAVTLRDVYRARRAIRGIAVRTPLIPSIELKERTGTDCHLKLENVQRSGAFKIRGAANKLRALEQEERTRGVITVSSGNHGRAVALVRGSWGSGPWSACRLGFQRTKWRAFDSWAPKSCCTARATTRPRDGQSPFKKTKD